MRVSHLMDQRRTKMPRTDTGERGREGGGKRERASERSQSRDMAITRSAGSPYTYWYVFISGALYSPEALRWNRLVHSYISRMIYFEIGSWHWRIDVCVVSDWIPFLFKRHSDGHFSAFNKLTKLKCQPFLCSSRDAWLSTTERCEKVAENIGICRCKCISK